MILATLLTGAAITVLAVLIFNLAVFALPFFAGVTIASLAYSSGAGFLGAAIIGLLAGAFLFAIGNAVLAGSRSPLLRLVVGITFAGPAALAGYAITGHVVAWSVPGGTWRTLFELVGGLVTGVVAWSRLNAAPPGTSVWTSGGPTGSPKDAPRHEQRPMRPPPHR